MTVSDKKPSEWAMALVRAASRYNDGCCETCRVGLEHEAAEIDTAIREAVGAEREACAKYAEFKAESVIAAVVGKNKRAGYKRCAMEIAYDIRARRAQEG